MRLTRDPRYRWVVAGMAFVSVFAAIGFGRFGYSAVLPSMQKALGLTSAEAGSLASWNQAGYTIMALIGGILASRFGRPAHRRPGAAHHRRGDVAHRGRRRSGRWLRPGVSSPAWGTRWCWPPLWR